MTCIAAVSIAILLCTSSRVVTSAVSSDEEKEIIEMLDFLQNYDLVKSLDMYLNMNHIEKMENEDNNNGSDAGKKEEEK